MKKVKLLSCFLFVISFWSIQAQTLTVNDLINSDDLINSLVNSNCDSSLGNNIIASPNNDSYGTFTASGNTNFDLTSGIVLTSGLAANAGNTNGNNEGDVNWVGSSLYESILGLVPGSTLNATDLEYSFTALEDNITLNYVFASEEFAGPNACSSNEGVVILIKLEDEPDSAFRNIALLDSGEPVIISNIHEEQTSPVVCDAANEDVIIGSRSDQNPFPNYARYTEILQANTNTIIGENYTIRVIVADQPNTIAGTDAIRDSAVFVTGLENNVEVEIEAIDLLDNSSITIGNDNTIDDCATIITLSVTDNASYTYQWFFEGTLLTGETTSTLNGIENSGNYESRVFPLASTDTCFVSETVNVNLETNREGNDLDDLAICVAQGGVIEYDLTERDVAAIGDFDAIDVVYSNITGVIVNETAYQGVNGEIITATVIEVGGCTYTSTFTLNEMTGGDAFNSQAVFDFVVCDEDTVRDDGRITILFNEINETIFPFLFNSNGELQGTIVYSLNSEATPFSGNGVNLPSGLSLFVEYTSNEGCVSNTEVQITINTGPVSSIDPLDFFIEVCDVGIDNIDRDGFATFDMTDSSAELIASIDPGTFDTIQFFPSVGNAENEINEIIDITAYRNTEENTIDFVQTVGVKVTNINGCFTIFPLQLRPRFLITNSDFEDEVVCDADGDGFEEFDLSSKEAEIVGGNNYSTEIYPSYPDLLARTNEITGVFQNTRAFENEVLYVVITDNDTGCQDYAQENPNDPGNPLEPGVASFLLIVEPIPEIIQPTIVLDSICDDDSDGVVSNFVTYFNTFDDGAFRDEISDDDAITISYFDTPIDANTVDLDDAIDDNFENIASSNPILTFYAIGSITNSGTTCFSNVISFEVTVNPAPTIPVAELDTIFECYLAADNPDAFEFRVDQNENQVNSNTDVTVTYYQTLAAAQLGDESSDEFIENATFIYDTSSFTEENTDPGSVFPIFYRLENNITGCTSFIEQEVIINTQPVVEEITDFILCVNAGETEAGFLLSSKDAEVLDNQTGKVVSYFSSQTDAENNENAVPLDIPFDSNGGQIIFVRVENDDDPNCNTTDPISQFTLEVEEFAVVGDATVINFTACDEDPTGVGFSAFFDLQEAINAITINGTVDVEVVFFSTLEAAGGDDIGTNIVQPAAPGIPLIDIDSEDSTNFILRSTSFTNSVVARITDNNSGCVQFQVIDLIINPQPSVDAIPNLEECDNLGDGVEIIDLTEIESLLNNNFNNTPAQILADLPEVDPSFDYFQTQADSDAFVEGGTLTAISDFENFQVSTGTTEVFVVITLEGCTFQSSFNVILNPLPVITSQTIEVCEDALGSNQFEINLATLNDDFEFYIDNNPNIELTYFSDAAGTLPLETLAVDGVTILNTGQSGVFTKTTNVSSIFLQAVNTVTTCESLEIIEIPLIALPLPTITMPTETEICESDIDDNDTINTFLDATILGGQSNNDFSVVYFLTSDFDSNLPIEDQITTSEISTTNYTAVVINTTTGCTTDSITFDFTVNLSLIIDSIGPLVVCDTDVDPDNSVTVDLTQLSIQFATGSPVEDISNRAYFTDSARTLEVTDPTIFLKSNNNDNAQTIYIDLTSDQGCILKTQFALQVNDIPDINDNPVELCEDALGSNQFEIDLATLNTDFGFYTDNDPDVELRFFEDALGANLITGSFTKTATINEIYLQAVSVDPVSGLECPSIIREIPLIALPLPTINSIDPTLLSICDEDGINDGEILFDFNTLTSDALGGQVGVLISYHATEQAAINGFAFNQIETSSSTFYVRVTNTATGCFNVSSFDITVNLLPEIERQDIFFCVDNPTRIFDLNTGNSDDTYLWSFPSGRVDETTSGITITQADVDTDIILTVTNAEGCETSEEFTITESPTPNIVPIAEMFFDTDEVVIRVDEPGNYLYALTKSTTVPDITDSEVQESNVFTDVLPGRFYAHVIDLNGCGDVTPVEVIFVDYFPFFTPNGEGPEETETWHIQEIQEIPNTIIYIYNRFGVLMTALTATSPGWDGTFQGKPMPTDDYWILIELENGDTIRDNITLKR